MGSVSVPTTEGFELQVNGPLCLSSEEPESLTWLAKSGYYVVGWVKLSRSHQHVGMLRELHLSESSRNPVAVATRLLSAVYDYARDHGLLKLKIHREAAHDCLDAALAYAGFSHDQPAESGRTLQAYVDLYRSPRSRVSQSLAEGPQTSEIRMAC